MMLEKILWTLFISLGTSLGVSAQVYEIENGTVSACGGVFYDDNGGVGDLEGTIGNDYSGTSYTYTICPENAGDGIQVSFVGFSVSQNVNPDNNDVLLIYNGDAAVGTPMGNSNSLNFSGITFSATADNPTGCLTFVFIHNDLNPVTGGWQADLECITPCSTPIASGTISSPIPDEFNAIQACLGEVISFADVGSAAAPGFTLENYIWNFGDGETSVGPANVEHEYDVPGEYIVTLVVEDNNGCQSTNVTPYQILVSTIPIFNTNFSEEVCLGGAGFLDGSPVQGVTWTSLPPQVVSGTTFLADGVGFEFNSSLDFNFFEDDQVLEDCADLYSIDVNMEHSYIGDLDIVITCPDGTEVILLDYPNGGGGGYLGEPIDIGGDFTPGVGYDYAWTPESVNGTFGDNAIGGQPLPSGSYEPTGDLCDLVGCPLNGQWTMTIVDNLGADDGNIFEWGISLNPELFPGVTTFTPEVGLSADSTFITGDFITSTSEDANYVEFTPPDLGSYDYTFTAINTFGCLTDTTVTIEVVPGPVVDAGEDLLICNDPLDLNAVIVSNDFEAEPCSFTFLLTSEGFGFNSAQVIISFDGVESQTIQAFGVSEEFQVQVPSGTEMSLEYVFSEWGEEAGNQVTVLDDTGTTIFESEVSPAEGVIFSETVTCLGDGQLQYEWSPATGLDNPFIPNPQVTTTQTVEYTVSVYPQGFEGCVTTDQVIIEVNPEGDPGISTTVELCQGLGEFNLIDYLEGTPVDFGTWTDMNGNDVGSTLNTLDGVEGTYTYTVQVNECITSSNLEIGILEEITMTVSDSQLLCQGSETEISVLTLNEAIGQQSFTWSNSTGVVSTDQTYSFSPQSSDQYCAEYVDLCPGETITACLDIVVEETPVVSFTSSNPMDCAPHTVSFENTSDPASFESVTWNIGNGVISSEDSLEYEYEEPGSYDVTLTLESALGCLYPETFENYVTIFQFPEPYFSYNPLVTTIPETEISFSNLTEGVITDFQWVFDTTNVLGISNQWDPVFEFPSFEGGTYPTSLSVTNANGCSATVVFDVVINDLFNVFIPTSFTPNGDGLNEVLSIKGTDVDPERFFIRIFNRWGEIVFESTDINNVWDGSHEQGDYYVGSEVYNYVIDAYSLATTQRFEIRGSLTVVR